jgi:hypothetical protein
MSDFTDEDVTAGGRALHDAWVRMDEGLDLFGKPAHQYLARAVLAAVLPEHDKRVLREAADYWHDQDRHVERWLRARADAEEMPLSVFPATPGAANVALDAEDDDDDYANLTGRVSTSRWLRARANAEDPSGY